MTSWNVATGEWVKFNPVFEHALVNDCIQEQEYILFWDVVKPVRSVIEECFNNEI